MLCPNCDTELEKRFDEHGEFLKCPTCVFRHYGDYFAKISQIFCYVIVDEKGQEGTPSVGVGGQSMPMITGFAEGVKALRPLAEQLKSQGHKVKLVRYVRTEASAI